MLQPPLSSEIADVDVVELVPDGGGGGGGGRGGCGRVVRVY